MCNNKYFLLGALLFLSSTARELHAQQEYLREMTITDPQPAFFATVPDTNNSVLIVRSTIPNLKFKSTLGILREENIGGGEWRLHLIADVQIISFMTDKFETKKIRFSILKKDQAFEVRVSDSSGNGTNSTDSANLNSYTIEPISLNLGKDFTFPIVNLVNKTKADRINAYMINSVLGDEFTASNLVAKLTERSKSPEGLSSLSYKVIIKTPTVLSLTILSCWIGAHESCGEHQFNFDLSTGYILSLDQIIMPSKWDEIKKLVCSDFKKRIVQVKNNAIKNMGSGWYEKNWLNESFEDSWQNNMKKEFWDIELEKSFTLSNNGIGFHYPGGIGLPMSIRELEPDSEYFYSWGVLKPFLMPSSPISTLIK